MRRLSGFSIFLATFNHYFKPKCFRATPDRFTSDGLHAKNTSCGKVSNEVRVFTCIIFWTIPTRNWLFSFLEFRQFFYLGIYSLQFSGQPQPSLSLGPALPLDLSPPLFSDPGRGYWAYLWPLRECVCILSLLSRCPLDLQVPKSTVSTQLPHISAFCWFICIFSFFGIGLFLFSEFLGGNSQNGAMRSV